MIAELAPIGFDHRPSSLFSSIKIENCETIINEQVDVLSPFITVFPRISEEDAQLSRFAYTFFQSDGPAFAANQDAIVLVARDLFGTSRPLDNRAQAVLNKSYLKSLRTVPTRPNRL